MGVEPGVPAQFIMDEFLVYHGNRNRCEQADRQTEKSTFLRSTYVVGNSKAEGTKHGSSIVYGQNESCFVENHWKEITNRQLDLSLSGFLIL